MNLTKQVTVNFGNTLVLDGEGFLFEVADSDLPYKLIGRDCVQVAQLAGEGAVVFCRKNNGELVSTPARNQGLYDILKTAVPTVSPDGQVAFGDRDVTDISEIFPRIRGVAVKDAKDAQRVSRLFEQRGYEMRKEYD